MSSTALSTLNMELNIIEGDQKAEDRLRVGSAGHRVSIYVVIFITPHAHRRPKSS